MGFFKDFSELLADGQQLTITLRREGQELIASVMPVLSGVKDKAVDNIVPIVVSGSPEEFDEGFFDMLRSGIPQAVGLVSNIKEYEKSVEAARNATEMAKKAKEEKDKLKKEFNGYVDLAKQNLSENKFVDAKYCLTKAAEIKDADMALIEKVRNEVNQKSGEGMIFGGPEDKSDGKNIVLGKGARVPAKPNIDTNPDSDNEDEEDNGNECETV